MQMYKGLPIITNKLREEEQRGIPHHLLGSIGLDEDPWVMTQFRREATRIISDIRDRGKTPIVVGGTSYYIDGLLFGRVVGDEKEAGSDGGAAGLIRDELAARYPILNASAEEMLAKLREVDPVMADKWHPNDYRKIRTSLEIYFSTGRRASDIYAEQQRAKESRRQASSATGEPHPLGDLLLFWLYAQRDALNARLDQRVDKMMRDGLLTETAEVYDYLQCRLATGETIDRSKGIWQSIGFRQFEPYHAAVAQHKATTQDSAPNPSAQPDPALEKLKQTGVEDTKTATRQYAKYQVRWITLKTLPALREEGLLNRFYVLDSSDIARWSAEVRDKAVSLAQQFLDGKAEAMPSPEDLSETAREVLAGSAERQTRAAGTPCRKVCEVCDNKVLLTEELWQAHISGKKHQKNVRAARRRQLVPASEAPERRLMVVEQPEGSDNRVGEPIESV
jgi:tRNA dimethylallyltransferase